MTLTLLDARNYEIVCDDSGICEDTQANLRSGAFENGPLSPRHDQSASSPHCWLSLVPLLPPA